VPLTRAELPDVTTGPVRTMHKAAAPSSTEPPNLIDSLKVGSFPLQPQKAVATTQDQHQMILSSECYEKGNLTSRDPSSKICCAAPEKESIFSPVWCNCMSRWFPAGEPGKFVPCSEQTAQ
jgi:hypothetical protein